MVEVVVEIVVEVGCGHATDVTSDVEFLVYTPLNIRNPFGDG